MQTRYLFVLLLYIGTYTQLQAAHKDTIDTMVEAFLNQKQTPDIKTHKQMWYVQVGAFTQKEPSSLLRKLQKKGYETIQKSVFRGEKRYTILLVGGYDTKQAAKEELKILKRYIPGAFIVRGAKE